MLSPADRVTLIRLLRVKSSDRSEFFLKLDAIEADLSQAATVLEVQRLLGLIAAQETQLQKSTTKQAGLTKADVLEFDPCLELRQIRSGISNNARQIANLIDWYYPSESAGSF